MDKKLYLADDKAPENAQRFAQLGYGFTENGEFSAPEPQADLLLLNDRNLPSEEGFLEALAFFREQAAWLLCDFERSPAPLLVSLLKALEPHRLIVPRSYASLPHAAVFLPPYRPICPFRSWLEQNKAKYGSVVLDLQPICCRLSPGSRLQQIKLSELPVGTVFFSDDLLCNYMIVRENGRPIFFFFDTEETIEARRSAADAPCIALRQEYQSLKARTL